MTRAVNIQGFSDLREIGSGGFGTVYAATEDFFERRVAVKVLNQELDASDRRRFERECQTMARLADHSNVVTLYSAGYTDDERPFIVMELVGGGSLTDRLKKGPLSWPEVQNIGLKMADALAHAHKEGVLHRDIKPANILMSSDEPKLTDFGIASFVDAAGTVNDYAVSWRHASPETVADTRDERSDIYSLGSTLYMLLKGTAPFARLGEENINPLLNRILNEEPPAIDRHDVPEELQSLILETLRKKPADRPQTAALLKDRLSSIGQTEPSTASTVELPDVSPGPSDALISDGVNEPARENILDAGALIDTKPKSETSTVMRQSGADGPRVHKISTRLPSAAPAGPTRSNKVRWVVFVAAIILASGAAVAFAGFTLQNWLGDRSSDAERASASSPSPDEVQTLATTADTESDESAKPTTGSSSLTTDPAKDDRSSTSAVEIEPVDPLPPSTELANPATGSKTTTETLQPTTSQPATTSRSTTRRTTTANPATTQRATTQRATTQRATTSSSTTRRTTTRRTTTTNPTTTQRATTQRATTQRATTQRATTQRATTSSSTTRRTTTTTTTTATTTPERVGVSWDASPSVCDENSKRSFSANVDNVTPDVLRLRMRILDSADNFVHQSHVYFAPASGQVQVLLGGIPSGRSKVQMINDSDDEIISQRTINFGTCA